VSSEKEAALGLYQLCVRFLADSNSWNVNGMPTFRTVRQMHKSAEPAGFSDNVLAQPNVLFSVQLLNNRISST